MSDIAPLDESERQRAIAKVPTELQPGVAGLAALVGPVFWWCADSFLVRIRQYTEFGMTRDDFLLVCRQFKRPEVQARLKRDSDFLAIFADFTGKAIAARRKAEAETKARAKAEAEAQAAREISQAEMEANRQRIRDLINTFASEV